MIEISGVYKNFNDVAVLKNINLTINKGDIFGIIGHSGAGKSTLLRCINGLETYDKGKIQVMGEFIEDLNDKEIRVLRKDLGMIFQSFNLLSRKTVFENIAMPLEVWGFSKTEIETKVNKLLDLVGLTEKAKVKPNQLSGGQKQRVAIARALALEPKVLLCDEATSALDPKTTKDILQLLNRINKLLGITVIIVTHQMEVIKEVCHKVALIEGGELVYDGSVEELFLKPNLNLKGLLGDEEDLLLEGCNIKLFFPSSISSNAIITSMARELDLDFSIIGGKIERFRENLLGSLTINLKEENKNTIIKYLNDKNIDWEVL